MMDYIGPEIKQYLACVTLDDLTGDARELAELIGMDAMREALAAFGGESLHLPHPRKIQAAMARYVAERYEKTPAGDNARELARELQTTTRVIRGYIRRRRS